METVAISKFKATCLAVLERVRKTGKPIRITRRGEPVADVLPPTTPRASRDWLGAMRDRERIRGDLVEPTGEIVPWESERG